MKILTLFCICILIGCTNPTNVSCRDKFEKNLEKNIEKFIATMPGLDSAIARKRGECMLNKLYEIDSTFVLMNGKDLDDFIISNSNNLRDCENITEQ